MFPVDHIGIAVEDLEQAIAIYTRQWGMTVVSREDLPERKVRLAFLKTPNTLIELLTPLGEGPLSRFLNKRGPGLHHICYLVADIEAELGKLKSAGQTLIDETPRKGAMGSLIAFISPAKMHGVLTELCQR